MIVTTLVPTEATKQSSRRKSQIGTTRGMLSSTSSSSIWPAAQKENDIIDTDEIEGIAKIQRLKYMSSSLGPIAILGGTASIYTKALNHSSSTLSPLSVICLILLAIQYSIMPRLTKKFIHPKANKTTIAMIEEVVKFVLGALGFVITQSKSQLLSTVKNWTFTSSLWAAGLPSALYAVQGVLTYKAYQNLDSVTFNGLTQFKTISAALCCYIVLGKKQSFWQMIALGLLFFSTLVFQGTIQSIVGSIRNHGNVNANQNNQGQRKYEVVRDMIQKWYYRVLKFRENHIRMKNQGSIHNSEENESNLSSIDKRHRLLWGILPCLGATLLSGLAGSLSQKSLQSIQSSSTLLLPQQSRDAYLYSAEISFFSAFFLVVSMVFSRGEITEKEVKKDSPSKKKLLISTQSKEDKNQMEQMFQYININTFIPIIVKSTGGILTALVHKYSGSVMKGFALVLGLVFSGVLQTIIDDRDLCWSQVAGTMLVLLSSWLHFTNPAM